MPIVHRFPPLEWDRSWERYDAPLAPIFSERERAILAAAAEGLTNREIAERLGIGAGDVKAGLSFMRRKVGVRTLTEVVRLAVHDGELRLPGER
jgi:DNA-binding NarL/FixJ family response regulator